MQMLFEDYVKVTKSFVQSDIYVERNPTGYQMFSSLELKKWFQQFLISNGNKIYDKYFGPCRIGGYRAGERREETRRIVRALGWPLWSGLRGGD